MKRTQLYGFIDIFTVQNPAEIRGLSQHSQIDRRFNAFHGFLNSLLVRRLLSLLSLRGRRFPTMQPWHDVYRKINQDRLWSALTLKASTVKNGPDEIEDLTRWVKGISSRDAIGPMVQQVVGRLFVDRYEASRESWGAAMLLDKAVRSKSPVQLIRWAITGEIRRAKALLGSKVDGDLAGVHGTGIALHNIVKGLEEMRELYARIDLRTTLSATAAAQRCLFAPAVVLRQATGDGEVAGCPFKKGALFMLGLGQASKHGDQDDLIFMRNTWSQCPAEKWVPALLEGVWKRATRPQG
jgi:hypothetical protein